MIGTYRDFVAVLEIDMDRLRCAEDYLNDKGKLLLKAYRKIRELTTFAESCQEMLELGVETELDENEKKAASAALKAIGRIAKAEAAQDGRAFTNQDLCEKVDEVCDQRCRFRDMEQEDLDDKCRECPMVKLAETIGV